MRTGVHSSCVMDAPHVTMYAGNRITWLQTESDGEKSVRIVNYANMQLLHTFTFSKRHKFYWYVRDVHGSATRQYEQHDCDAIHSARVHAVLCAYLVQGLPTQWQSHGTCVLSNQTESLVSARRV